MSYFENLLKSETWGSLDGVESRFFKAWILRFSWKSYLRRVFQLLEFAIIFVTLSAVFGKERLLFLSFLAAAIVIGLDIFFEASSFVVDRCLLTWTEIKRSVVASFLSFATPDLTANIIEDRSKRPWDTPLSEEYEDIARKIALLSKIYVDDELVTHLKTWGQLPEPSKVFEKLEKHHSVFLDFLDNSSRSGRMIVAPKISTYPSQIIEKVIESHLGRARISVHDFVFGKGSDNASRHPSREVITWLSCKDMPSIPILRHEGRNVWFKDLEHKIPFSLNFESVLRKFSGEVSILGSRSNSKTCSVFFYFGENQHDAMRHISEIDLLTFRMRRLAFRDYLREMLERLAAISDEPTIIRWARRLLVPIRVPSMRMRAKERVFQAGVMAHSIQIPDVDGKLVELEMERPDIPFDYSFNGHKVVQFDVDATM